MCLVRVLQLDLKSVDRGLAYSLCLCLCLVRVIRLVVKCVAKWCWSVADRGLGNSLCLCLCLVRVLRLDVKSVARGLASSRCWS